MMPTLAGNDVVIARRRRRFRRDPEFRAQEHSRAGRLQIRARDLDIITTIARHRYLDTHQLCLLFACACPRHFGVNQKSRPAPVVFHEPGCSCSCGVGSRSVDHARACPALFKDDQHLARRLRELYQHKQGYLDRPLSQVLLHVREGGLTGSRPMVYSVTKAGLDLIGAERQALIGRGKLSWVGRRQKGSSRLFIEHTIRVADVSVQLELALRKSRAFVRLSETELMSRMSEERRSSPRPFSVNGTYQRKKLSAVCDLAFAVRDVESGRRRNVLVEVDLGHMPIDRDSLTQTSIMRKLIAYSCAYDEKRFLRDLGWDNVAVLILTTSAARVASCVKAAQDFFEGAPVARLFLFGTLDAANDLLQHEFVDGRGKAARLLG